MNLLFMELEINHEFYLIKIQTFCEIGFGFNCFLKFVVLIITLPSKQDLQAFIHM